MSKSQLRLPLTLAGVRHEVNSGMTIHTLVLTNDTFSCNCNCLLMWLILSGFSQTHKIGNIGIIANFVSPYIYSFLPYLHHMVFANVKLDDNRYKRSIFQGCILHSFS